MTTRALRGVTNGQAWVELTTLDHPQWISSEDYEVDSESPFHDGQDGAIGEGAEDEEGEETGVEGMEEYTDVVGQGDDEEMKADLQHEGIEADMDIDGTGDAPEDNDILDEEIAGNEHEQQPMLSLADR